MDNKEHIEYVLLRKYMILKRHPTTYSVSLIASQSLYFVS